MRRFEYESQILARLRHPGIAQVYEAGTHRDDSGTVPFFAMEYIVGAKPITKYVQEKKLGTRERMELFAQVCDAVNHGHQKGIIHRDLKPSNILVDAQGQVKIIDFGVARSTDSDLAVTTLQTDIGQLIGTLQYMSPEQCEADPHNIDTRSDVYALGIVFYELLCGKLPYNVTRVAMHEATRIIREQHPTKLSTLNKTLRGDVETIALKALEKDRERRYQSATDFAQDIRRYLSNEAISARPPSMMYQFRVLVRRNKPIFAAIAAVFVVLVIGVIVSTSMYLRSEANRIRAEHEATKAETTLDFLEGMFRSADPLLGRTVDIKLLLDEAARKIDAGRFAEQPEIEASVRHTIGRMYGVLSLGDTGARHLQAALDIYRRVLGEEHPDTLRSASAYAKMLRRRGKYEEAETMLRQVSHIQRRVLGPEHPDTLRTGYILVTVLEALGKAREAEAMIRLTLDAQRRVLGPEHLHTLHSAHWLSYLLRMRGLYAEAERMQRDTLQVGRRSLGEHIDTLWFRGTLARALFAQGKLAEAESICREGLEIGRRRFVEEHAATLYMLDNLAVVLFKRGKLDEAERLSKRRLELRLAVNGERHEATLEAMTTMALIRRDQGRLTEAEELFRRVLELRREVLGEEHPQTLGSLSGLAQVLVKQGKPDQARPYFAELIRHRRRAAELPDANANDLDEYAKFLLTCEPEDLRDPQAALPLAKRAVEMSAGQAAAILDTLALAYFMTDDTPKAIETQEKAVSLLPPEESPLRAEYEANLAKYRAALSEQGAAEPTEPDAKIPP
jgi:tetratricopeptide (TPR) repeat protein